MKSTLLFLALTGLTAFAQPPVANQRGPDWLLTPRHDHPARIQRWKDTVVLTNGLVHREFRTNPGFG